VSADPLPDFSAEAREAVYAAIARRRDVRHFRPGVELPADVLARILGAAHLAPSVGYSQPWDFVVVRDRARRARIRQSFLRCREIEAERFTAARREKYLSLRLEGIEESSLNVCVTVDLRPTEEAILGTTAQPEALRWSACCAVQNLWLAARVEGVGVGWVSIVEPKVLRAELGLPPGVEPIAYLCVGYPVAFGERPLLEENGWRARRAFASAVHDECYRAPSTPESEAGTPRLDGDDGL
jgi:5,6-dimethylbenzimidazole synthase